MLEPLADKVIRNHLIGKLTIGIYPLLPDETGWFLAVNFDKKSWVILRDYYRSFFKQRLGDMRRN